jgi:hypothetical protein
MYAGCLALNSTVGRAHLSFLLLFAKVISSNLNKKFRHGLAVCQLIYRFWTFVSTFRGLDKIADTL